MKISDFLKSNLTINEYAKLFNTYNIERGADGYENVYDLNDFESFGYFVQLYNTPIAMKCKNKNRFWIGGLNFDEPKEFPTTIEALSKKIDLLILLVCTLTLLTNKNLFVSCFMKIIFQMKIQRKD